MKLDRDACARLYELLSEISASLKRYRSELAANTVENMLNGYDKFLKMYIKLLEKVLRPRQRFRIGRRKTVLQALSSVYKRLKKLVAYFSVEEKALWIKQCDSDLPISSEIVIQQLISALDNASDKEKTRSAKCIAELAFTESSRSLISRARGIAPLLTLLSGTYEQKNFAASALGYLTIKNDGNSNEIVERGAIPLLIEVLGIDAQGCAVFVLMNLASTDAYKAIIVQNNGIN